jgi:NAD(P)-dependent dehydrogenase (short-subunit alcohol dehydrogenase family)
MDPCQDKIAIVTGGASGIGRELCQQLHARGAAAVVGAGGQARSIEVHGNSSDKDITAQ